MTIAEVRQFIAKKINPPVKPENISLYSKGQILSKLSAHMKDYKFFHNQTIMVKKESSGNSNNIL